MGASIIAKTEDFLPNRTVSLVLLAAWFSITLITSELLPNPWQHGKLLLLWPWIAIFGMVGACVVLSKTKTHSLRFDLLDGLVFGRLIYVWIVHTPHFDILNPVLVLSATSLWYAFVRTHLSGLSVFQLSLSKALIGMALIQAVFVYIQIAISPENLDLNLKNAVFGTLGSPNSTAWLIALGVFALSFSALGARWKAFLTAFLLFALLLTESRSAILMVALSVVMTLKASNNRFRYVRLSVTKRFIPFWLSIKKHQTIALGILLFILLIVLILLNTESAFGRIYLYTIGIKIWSNNILFGVGLGNIAHWVMDAQAQVLALPFWAPFAYKATEVHQIHNEFLNACIETGLIGGLALILIYLRAFKNSPSHFHKTLGGLFFIPIMVDAPLHVLPISLLFYTWLGMSEYEEKSTVSLPFKRFSVLAVVMLCSGTVLLPQAFDRYNGLQQWKLGRDALELQRWDSAVFYFKESEKFLPTHIERDFQYICAKLYSNGDPMALKRLKNLVQYAPNKARLLTLAHAHITLREYDQAIVILERIKAAFPTHIAPHRYLAEVYHRLGDKENSLKHHRSAHFYASIYATPTNSKLLNELEQELGF